MDFLGDNSLQGGTTFPTLGIFDGVIYSNVLSNNLRNELPLTSGILTSRTLSVSSNINFSGKTTINNNIYAIGRAGIGYADNAVLNSNFNVLGTADFSSNMNVGGSLTQTGTSNNFIFGKTTFNSNLVVSATNRLYAIGNVGVGYADNTALNSNFNVLGTADFSSNMNIAGSLTQTGTSNITLSGNVAIGTNNPVSRLTVNPVPLHVSGFNFSTSPVTITNINPTSTSIINDPRPVLHLCRDGTSGQTHAAKATFNLCRYENNYTNSRTRLDISLSHNSFDDINVMSIRSDGNVGIGTTNPQHYLDLFNNINASYSPMIRLRGGGNPGNEVGIILNPFFNRTGAVASKIVAIDDGNSSAHLGFFTAPTGSATEAVERIRIRNDGNVGIANNNPANILQVADGGRLRISNGISDFSLIGTRDNFDAVDNTRIVISGSTRGTFTGCIEYIATSISGYHRFYTTSSKTERLTIKPDGNVGIGNIDPANIFQVGSGERLRISNGSSDFTVIGVWDTASPNNTQIKLSGHLRGVQAGNIEYQAVNTHKFYTTSLGTYDERLTIRNNGNVGIGSTNPLYILDVNGSINSATLFQKGTQIEFNSYATSNNLYTSNYTEERQYPSKSWNSNTNQISNNTGEISNIAPIPYIKETISLNTTNITYGSGTYNIYASADAWTGGTFQKKELFNTSTDDGGGIWTTDFTRYNTTTGYFARTDCYIKDINYYGDWIILNLPNPILLTRFRFYFRPAFISHSPSLWRCYGSMDGINWNLIIEATNDITPLITNNYNGGFYNHIVNENYNKYYNYIGFVVNKVVGGYILNFAELQIFGKEVIKTLSSERQYPPGIITSVNTILNGFTYGNGTYNILSSIDFSSNESINNVFDINNATWWTPSNLYTGANNTYNGSTTTIINGTSYTGEWIQINLPVQIFLTKYNLFTRMDVFNRGPHTFWLAGSNNGVAWVLIDSQSNITGYTISGKLFTLSSQIVPYSFYRLIINRTNGDIWTSISEFQLFGREELLSITPNFISPNNLIKDVSYNTGEKQYPPRLYDSVSSETTASADEIFNCVPSGISVFKQLLTLNNHGVYTLYYSSSYESSGKNQLFDYITTDSGAHWVANQYSDSSGIYSNNNYIKDSTYKGDWIIIKFPYSIILTRFRFYFRPSLVQRAPSLWRCYGSNDGFTFTEIPEASMTVPLNNLSYFNNYYEDVLISTFNTPYLYIGFVFSKTVGGVSAASILNFNELQIFGRDSISTSLLSGWNKLDNSIYLTNTISDIITSNVSNRIFRPSTFVRFNYGNEISIPAGTYNITFNGVNAIGKIAISTNPEINDGYSYPLLIDSNNNEIVPIIWYKFNNNLNNSGSYGTSFNASSTGGLAYDTVDFIKNNSLSLTASTQFITIPSSLNLNEINTTSGITISLWVKINMGSSGNFGRVLDYGEQITNAGANYFLITRATNIGSTIRFEVVNGSTSILYDYAYTTNTWIHIVWSITTNGIWNIYINNQSIVSTTNNQKTAIIAPTSAASRTFQLNKSKFTGDGFLSIKYDDFRIYALVVTPRQVNELYNGRVEIYQKTNIGIGTNNPISQLTVNPIPLQVGGFNFSTSPVTITNINPTSTSIINDPRPVLHLCRDGTNSQSHAAKATFNLCRYENAGHLNAASRTRLDLALTHDGFNDVNIMSIRSDGNVGIGTTNPQTELELFDPSNPKIFLNHNGTARYFISGTSTSIDIGNDVGTSKIIRFMPDNVERMFINNNGSVGIGTNAATSANTKLTVIGSGISQPLVKITQTAAWNGNNYALEVDGYTNLGGFRINGSDTVNSLYQSLLNTNFGFSQNPSNSTGGNITMRTFGAAGNIIFSTSGDNERMRINPSGNVGIANNNPGNILQVGSGGRLRIANNESDYTTIGTNDIESNTTNTSILLQGRTGNYTGAPGAIFYFASNGTNSSHNFWCGGIPRMIIASNGLITTSSNIDCGGGISLTGSTAFFNNGGVDLINTSNTYINFKGGNSGSDWCYLRQIGDNENIKLALDFHDDIDARFCIRNIQSTNNPDGITEVFSVNGVNGECIMYNNNPSLAIRAADEYQTSILYLSTPNGLSSALKTAIIADGSGIGWSRSKLHFCLNNNDVSNHTSNNATIADARMTIDPNGSIGIGISSPIARLHIREATGTTHNPNSGTIILDHDNNGGASSITFRSAVNRGSDYGYIQYQDTATVLGGGEAAKLIIGTQNDGDDDILIMPSGNVGINTNAPAGYKLNVNGSTYMSGLLTINNDLLFNRGNPHIQFGSTNGNNLALASENSFFSTFASAGDMVLRSLNKLLILSGYQAPAITINTNNFVGIGTTNPQTLLDVRGIQNIQLDTTGTPGIGTYGSGGGNRLILWNGNATAHPFGFGIAASTIWYGCPDGSRHEFYTGNTRVLFINSTSIQTPNPITINGQTGANLLLNLTSSTTNDNCVMKLNGPGNIQLFIGMDGTTTANTLTRSNAYLITSGNLIFFTNNRTTEANLLITTSGNVGIATNNPVLTLQVGSTNASHNIGRAILTASAGNIHDADKRDFLSIGRWDGSSTSDMNFTGIRYGVITGADSGESFNNHSCITFHTWGNSISSSREVMRINSRGVLSILGQSIFNYLFNNTGANHGDISNFDSVSHFGYKFIQGTTSGPGTPSAAQYYSWYIGLGANHPATGNGSYGAQFALPRNVTNPVMSIRFNENNSWSSWSGITAAALTSGDKTISGKLTVDGLYGIVYSSPNISLATTDSNNHGNTCYYSAFGGDTNLYSHWGCSINLNSAGINPSGNSANTRIANTSSFTINHKPIGGTAATAYNNLFTVRASGNVGIGVTDPVTRLEVGSFAYTTPTINARYFHNDTPIAQGPIILNLVCCKLNGVLWVTSAIASSSDERIKTNINDIIDDSALQKILQIQPKTYEYIDKIQKGTDKVYGFIAQQIKEIIPEAVNIEKSLIPNIYSICDCSSNIINLQSSNIEKIKINDKISIIEENKNINSYIITDIIKETNQIKINSNLESSKCFVYGTEIDDFHTLDKSYIYTLNVCATQELYRQIQEQKTKIDNLQMQIDELKQLINK